MQHQVKVNIKVHNGKYCVGRYQSIQYPFMNNNTAMLDHVPVTKLHV